MYQNNKKLFIKENNKFNSVYVHANGFLVEIE